MRRNLPLLLLPLLALLALASCSTKMSLDGSEEVFGTLCTIRLVDGASKAALEAAFAVLHRHDHLLSPVIEDSEISAVNRAAGKAAVKVSPETLAALRSALGFARVSGGVVDPTVYPLVQLWGIGTEAARIPSKEEIAAALKLVDWKDVIVDEAASTVRLARPGMALDLGAFAKGWSADRVKEVLAARGVRAAIIDLGGNIFVFGKKPDGSPWKVGVQDPRLARGAYMGIVSSLGASVTTAGTYERYFEKDGIRYHHILDLGTGAPARSGLLAATVVADTSEMADGIDTAIFILGREKGLRLAATLPGVRVILADEKGKVWFSPGANRDFQLTSKDWAPAE